jgi:uroporphyrinogen-III decarboxylase
MKCDSEEMQVKANTTVRKGALSASRKYYLDLAASGIRMPIGTDLVLHEKDDPASIRLDGIQLGKIIEESATRYRTPLAIPLMDLTIEKEAMLSLMGVSAEEIPTYHFHAPPAQDLFDAVDAKLTRPITPRMSACVGAIEYIAKNTSLVPCGMSIGPFSLMTKLIADPIAPVYLAGMGVTGAEDPEVATIEKALELALKVIQRSITFQIKAGAKMIIVCEPAANQVFLSPKQLDKGSDIFERYVMAPNREVKALLDEHEVDLFLHDCGELTNPMVENLASLDPAMLSLGSSRVLWEDAALVPDDIVMYGNLPTKKFISSDLTVEKVVRQADELVARMKQTGHPFILGSECDVLSVPGAHADIARKVAAFARMDDV